MSDTDALEGLKQLRAFNTEGVLTTPKNTKYSAFLDGVFDHAIRALSEKIEKS